jgi:serine/threonine protein kinase
MASILSIKNILNSKRIHTRTLNNITVDSSSISAGNNAVTVRCKIDGREGEWLLKCYFRKKRHLDEIYGDDYYPNELRIYSINGEVDYIDVVVKPWVAGWPLDRHIGYNGSDYTALSREFDILALNTLDAIYAHGDIKPENIIVGSDNKMTLIDFDAMWRPEFDPSTLSEIGTLSYRHPNRKTTEFNKHIDDYPLALISTALAALALDQEAMKPFIKPDKTLFTPKLCLGHRDRALNEAKRIFLEHKDTNHYRIAECIESPQVAINNLRELLYNTINGITEDFDSFEPVVHKVAESAIKYSITEQDLDIMFRDRLIARAQRHIYRMAKAHHYDNKDKVWSEGEETLLTILLFDGHSIPTIARKLARSEQAVRARIRKLKLSIPEQNRKKEP